MTSPGVDTSNAFPPPSCGTIDHMCDVLNHDQHPFILVGPAASRWMGSRGGFDDAFDIVLRNQQLKDIVSALVQTGHWMPFDAQAARQDSKKEPLQSVRDIENTSHQYYLDYTCEADAVLDRVDQQFQTFSRLRLWSENSYRIKVDDCPLIEVPDIYAWNSFLVEDTYHPANNRNDGWWYGPATLTNPGECKLFPPKLPRGKSPNVTTPIFIPSIPPFVDAIVDQCILYKAGSKPTLASDAVWQLESLTRYLYLELPHQRNTILFGIEARNEKYLDHYLETYKRKPSYVLDTETKQLVLANKWDPESYPESCRKRWRASKTEERP